MSKTIGRFSYRIAKMGKQVRMPFNPIVQLTLENWIEEGENKTPIISAHLMTEGEIDEYISALKDDLDAVGRKAKAALRKAIDEARDYKGSAVT